MYVVIKIILRTLLLPPASPLIVAAFGALLMRRYRAVGVTLVSLAGVSLWLFSTGMVADALAHCVETHPALDLSTPTQAQAVVIIGGGGARSHALEYRGPAADPILLQRLAYGAYVAHRTGLPVLVSGAPVEALVMKTSLARDFGIEARWVEGDSRDTYQNARFSARILEPLDVHRIVLVTMSTHMARAVHEFQAAGFEVVAAPTGLSRGRDPGGLDVIPTADALALSSAAVYELIGEPMRRLQAYLGVRERFERDAPAAEAPSAALRGS